jgi:hypothetical protein
MSCRAKTLVGTVNVFFQLCYWITFNKKYEYKKTHIMGQVNISVAEKAKGCQRWQAVGVMGNELRAKTLVGTVSVFLKHVTRTIFNKNMKTKVLMAWGSSIDPQR